MIEPAIKLAKEGFSVTEHTGQCACSEIIIFIISKGFKKHLMTDRKLS